MRNSKTLRIPLASLERAISARSRGAAVDDYPLRMPDPSLTPAGQAVDLLDCIDEALTWAEESMQTAVRVSRSVGDRASALGLSTGQLHAVVEACLGRAADRAADPRSLVPATGGALVDDLVTIAAALDTACTRSRAAGKHVMRLSLLAPGLARRARARSEQEAGDPESRAATHAWLAGFSGRAKAHADRAREGLGGLPAQAEVLRGRLLHLRVPRVRRRRSIDTQAITQRLIPAPLV